MLLRKQKGGGGGEDSDEEHEMQEEDEVFRGFSFFLLLEGLIVKEIEVFACVCILYVC